MILIILDILQKNNLIDKVLLDNYGISNNGILELNDEITYNDQTYILDSCILGNFNTIGKMGHAIIIDMFIMELSKIEEHRQILILLLKDRNAI